MADPLEHCAVVAVEQYLGDHSRWLAKVVIGLSVACEQESFIVRHYYKNHSSGEKEPTNNHSLTMT